MSEVFVQGFSECAKCGRSKVVRWPGSGNPCLVCTQSSAAVRERFRIAARRAASKSRQEDWVRRVRSGETYAAIARDAGLSPTRVRDVVRQAEKQQRIEECTS